MTESPTHAPQSMRECLRLWLDALNREHGSRLEMDGDGSCVLATGERTPCVVRASDEYATLYFTAAVGRLADPQDARALRAALAWNRQGPGTMGPALALDTATDEWLLSQAWTPFAAGLDAFSLMLGHFMETADRLREAFGGAPVEVAPDPSGGPSPFMLRA